MVINKEYVVETIIDSVNIGLWACGAVTAATAATNGVIKICKKVSTKVKEHKAKKASSKAEAADTREEMTAEEVAEAAAEILREDPDLANAPSSNEEADPELA